MSDVVKGKVEQPQFVFHTLCPECGSVDNRAVYVLLSKNLTSSWCFGCCTWYGHRKNLEEGLVEPTHTFTQDDVRENKKPLENKDWDNLLRKCSAYSGDAFDTRNPDGSFRRGVRPEIAAKFSHVFERDSKGNIIFAYYPETNEECKFVGVKTRQEPKNFIRPMGITGSKNQLSGQHLFMEGGKRLVIVAGEEDKLAAYQMFLDSQKTAGYAPTAVVSPTAGEGSAAKQVALQYDFCDKFDDIVVCMDNDDAGREAAEEIAKALPRNKVRIMFCTGYKDACDMLVNGMQKQFISDFYQAKPYQQTGISPSFSALDKIEKFLKAPKIYFPPEMDALNKATGGIPTTGHIINIIGNTSIGKSTFSDRITGWWQRNSVVTPTTVSIERSEEEFFLDNLSNFIGINLRRMEGHSAWDYLSREDVKPKIQDFMFDENGRPRYYIIDERGSTLEKLKSQVDRAGKQFGSKLIIFDPLTDILQSSSLEEQEAFTMWQKQLKKEGYIFINVLHTRKVAQGTGEFVKAGEYDAKGTGSFIQSGDINIVLNRNKMAEDDLDKNTTIVDMPKCRNGETGHVMDLIYDPATRQQVDKRVFLENLEKSAAAAGGNIHYTDFEGELIPQF